MRPLVVCALFIGGGSTSVAMAAATTGAACDPHANVSCSLLGDCVDGACVCRPGWTGADCGVLNLAPADPVHSQVWPPPNASSPAAARAAGWGFSTRKSPADGMYHAFANVLCGPTATAMTAGTVVHLRSAEPDRGYQYVGTLANETSFGPHLVHRRGDDALAVYFRSRPGADAGHPTCSGSDRPSTPAYLRGCAELNVSAHCIHTGDLMVVGWAPWAGVADAGAWDVQNFNVTGCGDMHKSNPTAVVLRPDADTGGDGGGAADGDTLLSFRFNGNGGEHVGFARSADFRGPFESTANLSHVSGNDEDSFVWQEVADGSLHILYHNRANGLHAFSGDGGLTWHKSAQDAFTLNIAFSNGTTVAFGRRERPDLLFDDQGRPTYFFTAVETAGVHRSWSLVQPVSHSQPTGVTSRHRDGGRE